MRTKKKYVKASIEKSLHEKLVQDRDEFNKNDNENKWSLSDTIEAHRDLAKEK